MAIVGAAGTFLALSSSISFSSCVPVSIIDSSSLKNSVSTTSSLSLGILEPIIIIPNRIMTSAPILTVYFTTLLYFWKKERREEVKKAKRIKGSVKPRA